MDNILCQLKPFSKDADGEIVAAEDLITQDLEKILNNNVRTFNLSFAFQNQHKAGIYSTDISVYNTSSYEDFCWIEAKRLPTPEAGTKRDEREYVIVSQEKVNGVKKFKGNGGIQRFKENKHAHKLPFSIMIGYIQEKDASYWLEKINGWIRELINTNAGCWDKSEYLWKYTLGRCDKYLSTHGRKDKTSITLHHYWITLQ
jgi:hypothetical protein